MIGKIKFHDFIKIHQASKLNAMPDILHICVHSYVYSNSHTHAQRHNHVKNNI